MILVSSQPQLDLYTYRPLDSQSIVALKEQLAASGHYKTVQLEIIQGGAHAK